MFSVQSLFGLDKCKKSPFSEAVWIQPVVPTAQVNKRQLGACLPKIKEALRWAGLLWLWGSIK